MGAMEMNTKLDLFDISDMAVRIASKKLNCRATSEGVWDDMFQSAFTVCLEIERSGIDRHRGYYLSAAIRAAQSQCIWLQSWNKQNHVQVTIERHTHESELYQPPELRSKFTIQFCILCKYFLSLRQIKGKQAVVGAMEDAKVVSLILMGYNNKEIGETMGTDWKCVASRRQRIQKRLKQEIIERG